METTYYRWCQEGGAEDAEPASGGYPRLQLRGYTEWDLRAGHPIDNWDLDTVAVYDQESDLSDFPFTNNDLPVYSPRLRTVMEALSAEDIQYLPLRIQHEKSGKEVHGYHLVNYLRVIDCLDRESSVYQIWTKDNLLFWEQRPHMLGTFRDVQKAVLDPSRIGQVPVFRLWGWKNMVIVRGDSQCAIETAGITGCRFSPLAVT
jgi:hypothetical protein